MITNDNNKQPTPIHLLSGFLGSGKTTLLANLLDHLKSEGLKPAVIMNELGEVNLDGELINRDVPMAEMLGGCICCSIRGDLGVEIGALIDQHSPDVIIIESTGAANPMETLDGVTDSAMYQSIELQSVVTVVDGPELLERSRVSKGQTFKLMKEQIRCATMLLLNKSDKLAPEQLVEAQQLLREMNVHAPIVPTVRCELEDWGWLDHVPASTHAPADSDASCEDEHCHCGSGSEQSMDHDHHYSHDRKEILHHTHEHVMVVTHYFNGPVDSEAFETMLRNLPNDIYRAKGIVSFTDTTSGSRFLFQYAYKESDFIRIEPQGKVHDVAVFIGEHFSREWLENELAKLNTATDS